MLIKKLVGKFTYSDLLLNVQDDLIYQAPVKQRSRINKIWEEARGLTKKNKGNIWNGEVYRLIHLKEKNKKIYLDLGVIEYKTHYSASKIPDFSNGLDFWDLPNGIIISAYIKTTDDRFIFSLKSSKSFLTSDINLIGGTLNKDEMTISEGEDIFKFFEKEFTEETNLDNKIIENIQGLGIFATDNYKIAIFLLCQLNIDYIQFQKFSHPNFEHDRFIIYPKNQLNSLSNKTIKINPNILSTLNLI